MKDRAFNLVIDKEKLARDIMEYGGISCKDAGIILGMKTTEAFRVKLNRGSISLEDIIVLGRAAGLNLVLNDDYYHTIFVSDYCYNPDVEAQLTKWKDCKKEVIEAEIRRLEEIKEHLQSQ